VTCVFGIDIVSGSSLSRKKGYAVFVIENGDEFGKIVSKVKLFRMIRKFKPSIIAIDNVFELFESKEELVSFLKNVPPNTKLVQVAGKQSLPALAKRFGLSVNVRNPMDEAKACAYLSKLGVGDEVSVFIDKTIITVSRNRSLGRGGWRQNKYRRKVHDSIRHVFNEIKRKLDEHDLEYVEDVKHAYGGISKGVLVVNAPKEMIPINPFRFGDVQVRVEAVEKEKIEFIPLRKSKPFVIVGVDPGTTTAIAIADLNGNLLGVKSKKGWNHSEIVEYITSMGKPVVVATDKSSPPEFVSKLKALFNAVLWTPKGDMSVEKKRNLTSRYTYLNDHERDAIAVVISAYNSFKNKIRNVEKRVPVGIDVDFVKAEVIRGTPLKDVLTVEEKRDVDVKHEEKKIVTVKSFKILDELRHENEVLRKTVSELKSEIERLRSKIVEMSKESYEKLRRDNYIQTLQSEISELRKELRKKDLTIKELEEKVETLKRMKVLELKGWRSVKVLKKFTKEEIEELEKAFGIDGGDVILIQDPSGGGKSTAEILCGKGVKAVLVNGEMSHLAKSVFEDNEIPVIGLDEIEVMTSEFFAIVKSDVFEKVYKDKLKSVKKKKLDKIEEILIDYKKRRC
jgi:predicted RNase H-like nuclease (RuvC/YqgF family)